MSNGSDSRRFEQVLAEALEALEAGERQEDILARYPDAADDLQPALEAVAALSGRRLSPDRQAQAVSRREFLAAAEQLAAAPLTGRPAGALLRRALSVVAGLALVVLLFGAGLTLAAGPTIPGDALYPLKLSLEGARFAFTNDPAGLRRDLAARRWAELAKMLDTGRDGQLELLGFVDALDADTLTLDGRELPLAGAGGADLVTVGDEVAVLVQVTGDAIRVLEIRLLVPGNLILPATTPSPPPASPASPTVTPLPTPTSSRTASPTGTSSIYPTETATETPGRPTSPPPTATPRPGDDTPEPVETEEPDDTPEPTETDEPDETPEPDETEEPDDTPEPSRTDEPDDIPEPDETEEPDDTPEP